MKFGTRKFTPGFTACFGAPNKKDPHGAVFGDEPAVAIPMGIYVGYIYVYMKG